MPHTSGLRVGLLTLLSILSFCFFVSCSRDSLGFSVCKIDRHQSSVPFFVRQETAPKPVTRISHQPPFHRIGVHILQFLSNLLGAVYVKIVEPRLPKSPQPRVAFLKCQAHLSSCQAAFPFSQITRNALLQNFQHQRWRTFRPLADEQVNMLGHHNVSNQEKMITITNFCQRRDECIPGSHCLQKRQPPVAAESQKMEMASSVVAPESFRHCTIPKLPHVTPTCGAPSTSTS